MRKLIITSACTLLLSLFGALGANQDSFNIKDEITKELNTEAVVQQTEETTEETANTEAAEVAKEANDLPAETAMNTPSAKKVENKTEDTTDVVKEVATEQREVTPKDTARNTTKNETTKKETTKTQATTAPKAANSQKSNDYVQPANDVATKDTVLNSDTMKKIVYDSKNDCYTLNGKVIAYGNVDPSQFGSIDEILAKFKDGGFKVETPSNNNNNGSNDGSQKENTTPKQPTKPTPAPSNNDDAQNNSGQSSYANQVLQLVNQERAKAGLSAFTTNSTLTAAANKRAQETKQSFSHTRPNGTSFSTVFKEFNISYRTSGENIAYGQRSPEEVVNGWMNSPGHRANILNGNFNKIGIGVYESNGTIYWSQLFTN